MEQWIESDEGRKAGNPFTLPAGENSRQYLKNRLESAFQAGIRAAEGHGVTDHQKPDGPRLRLNHLPYAQREE